MKMKTDLGLESKETKDRYIGLFFVLYLFSVCSMLSVLCQFVLFSVLHLFCSICFVQSVLFIVTQFSFQVLFVRLDYEGM